MIPDPGNRQDLRATCWLGNTVVWIISKNQRDGIALHTRQRFVQGQGPRPRHAQIGDQAQELRISMIMASDSDVWAPPHSLHKPRVQSVPT